MATIGGQAVLEGVMMRGPSSWAVAVRRPDGRISEIAHDVESVALRRRWLRLPVIRGVVALGESLAIGMRALAVSARFSVTDEGEEDASEELGRFALIGSFVFAIGFSLLLFKVSPALLTNWINPDSTWIFLLIEGGIRIGLLVAYLVLIGFFGELRRVFQYHAAEHKAINAYEAGSAARARGGAAPQPHPRALRHGVPALGHGHRHPRLLAARARPPLMWLVVSRVVALPLIAGLAYEVIRLAARYNRFVLVRAVLAPGLWLQRLTTREPTLDQVAVSIRALERVLAAETEPSAAGRASRSWPERNVDAESLRALQAPLKEQYRERAGGGGHHAHGRGRHRRRGHRLQGGRPAARWSPRACIRPPAAAASRPARATCCSRRWWPAPA